jgi:hypothetical protein
MAGEGNGDEMRGEVRIPVGELEAKPGSMRHVVQVHAGSR